MTTSKQYSKYLIVDGHRVTLQIHDTPGYCDFDRWRPLAYPNTDVFVLCFSFSLPSSVANLKQVWVSEVKQFGPNVPMILVGAKSDIKKEENENYILLESKNVDDIATYETGLKLSKEIEAEKYVECSALTGEGVQEVFEESIRVVLARRPREKNGCAVS